MSTNIAGLIVKTLAAAGVKRIYGVVGDSLNGLTEALRKQTAIEWVPVRHEEVAMRDRCSLMPWSIVRSYQCRRKSNSSKLGDSASTC